MTILVPSASLRMRRTSSPSMHLGKIQIHHRYLRTQRPDALQRLFAIGTL